MSDEALDLPADDTAPVAEATAAPAPVDTQPDEATTEATKSFTQEELDAIVGKRRLEALSVKHAIDHALGGLDGAWSEFALFPFNIL